MYNDSDVYGPMVSGIELLIDIANREYEHSRRTAELVRSMADEAFPMPRRLGAVVAVMR